MSNPLKKIRKQLRKIREDIPGLVAGEWPGCRVGDRLDKIERHLEVLEDYTPPVVRSGLTRDQWRRLAAAASERDDGDAAQAALDDMLKRIAAGVGPAD
tara:strand:- start:91 stop:387 length:297 start_codon:yes stop_codon:yes gene_type:complete